MRRILISLVSVFLCSIIPSGSSHAAYQHFGPSLTNAQPRHNVARPIHSSTSHWKAQIGTLKTYADASQTLATRNVGQHTIQYAPSRVTIEGLLAKRALNPARFDQTFKTLGRLLARDERIRAGGNTEPLNGLLYPSAKHNYLRWRRSLNPARFDHYHPIRGAILAEDLRIRNLLTHPSGGETIPPIIGPGIPAGNHASGGPPGGGNPPPGVIEKPPVVPEPRSIVLFAFGALGIAYVATKRRLRRG